MKPFTRVRCGRCAAFWDIRRCELVPGQKDPLAVRWICPDCVHKAPQSTGEPGPDIFMGDWPYVPSVEPVTLEELETVALRKFAAIMSLGAGFFIPLETIKNVVIRLEVVVDGNLISRFVEIYPPAEEEIEDRPEFPVYHDAQGREHGEF